jgi:transposase-like protein
MSIVVLRLPDVKGKSEERPEKCPYCKGEIFQRWGEVSKPVRDSQLRQVKVYRYYCCGCKRTFRHYPEGVDRADQTLRLRKLAALCWTLGLSYRGVTAVFGAFGISVCYMTVWRDMLEQSDQQKQSLKWQPVRVLGLDGAYVRGWGELRPMLVAIDLGNGQPVMIGEVDEHDPQAVCKWLEPLVQRLGVSVIVTDDLLSYHVVARHLDLEHQVCQFHVRRWVGRALHQLQESLPEEWLWVIQEVKQLIAELPTEGGRRLFELWKQVAVKRTSPGGPLSAVDELRKLLIRLSDHWDSYRVFDWQPDVPWTNNATEQAIGRMKMRSRTVRGYKSWPGMQAGLMLAGNGVC